MNPYRNVIIKTIAVIVFIAAMVFYFFVNSEDSAFVPKCVFKHLLGYDCPSCGAQRAFHSVLHGDFMKALSYNPFLLISVPYFLIGALCHCLQKSACKKNITVMPFMRI